jgi:hypothetical protein
MATADPPSNQRLAENLVSTAAAIGDVAGTYAAGNVDVSQETWDRLAEVNLLLERALRLLGEEGEDTP